MLSVAIALRASANETIFARPHTRFEGTFRISDALAFQAISS